MQKVLLSLRQRLHQYRVFLATDMDFWPICRELNDMIPESLPIYYRSFSAITELISFSLAE